MNRTFVQFFSLAPYDSIFSILNGFYPFFYGKDLLYKQLYFIFISILSDINDLFVLLLIVTLNNLMCLLAKIRSNKENTGSLCYRIIEFDRLCPMPMTHLEQESSLFTLKDLIQRYDKSKSGFRFEFEIRHAVPSNKA